MKLKKETLSKELGDFSELLDALSLKIKNYSNERVFVLLDGSMGSGKSQFRDLIKSNIKDVNVYELDSYFKGYQDFSKPHYKLIFNEEKLKKDINKCSNKIIVIDGIGSKRIFNNLFKGEKNIIINMINFNNRGTLFDGDIFKNNKKIFKDYKDYILNKILKLKEDSLIMDEDEYLSFSEDEFVKELLLLNKDKIRHLFFDLLKDEISMKKNNNSITAEMEAFNSSYEFNQTITGNNEISYFILNEYSDTNKTFLSIELI